MRHKQIPQPPKYRRSVRLSHTRVFQPTGNQLFFDCLPIPIPYLFFADPRGFLRSLADSTNDCLGTALATSQLKRTTELWLLSISIVCCCLALVWCLLGLLQLVMLTPAGQEEHAKGAALVWECLSAAFSSP